MLNVIFSLLWLDVLTLIHVKHHFDATFEPVTCNSKLVKCTVGRRQSIGGHASTKSAKYFIPPTSAGS